MLEFIYLVFMILFLFGITIFVHEWGHFIVARKCGLQVDAFAIGMGPSIYQKKIDGIVYKICIFPIGGYVSLPQLDPEGMKKIQGDNNQEKQILKEVSPWKKIAVAIAGPLCNIIFALFLGCIVLSGDHPKTPALVGTVEAESQAYSNGLRSGDEIISIGNNNVSSWYDVRVEALLGGSNTISDILIIRSGYTNKINSLDINNPEDSYTLINGVTEAIPCIVGGIISGSPAESANMQTDDIIRSFNHTAVNDWNHFTDIVQNCHGEQVPVIIERGKGQLINLNITPEFDQDSGRMLIGIKLGGSAAMPWTLYGNPIDQIKSDSSAIFRLLKALTTPQEAEQAAKGLGGPVAIFSMIWMALKMGFINALALMRFININLAILNLLPIPVLDGGHIVFSLLEGITRKKIPSKLIAILTNIFAILLITAMIWLSIRDVERVVDSKTSSSSINTVTNTLIDP